jgi:hypothetical protein
VDYTNNQTDPADNRRSLIQIRKKSAIVRSSEILDNHLITEMGTKVNFTSIEIPMVLVPRKTKGFPNYEDFKAKIRLNREKSALKVQTDYMPE